MTTSLSPSPESSPPRGEGTRLFSRSQHLGEAAQLPLPAHARKLSPPLVVHRLERQDHVHAAPGLLELDRGLDLIWLDAGNEIRELHEDETVGRLDLRVPHPMVAGERHASLLHVFHLVRADRAHRISQLAARTEIQRAHGDAESLRAPPRFDTVFCRPQLPHLFWRGLERTLEGELGTVGHATGAPL